MSSKIMRTGKIYIVDHAFVGDLESIIEYTEKESADKSKVVDLLRELQSYLDEEAEVNINIPITLPNKMEVKLG